MRCATGGPAYPLTSHWPEMLGSLNRGIDPETDDGQERDLPLV